MNVKRVHNLNTLSYSRGHIVYWMSRDQRVYDNWALIYAQELAKKYNTHVEVIFCLRSSFEFNTARIIDFMLTGLEEVEKTLAELQIPFSFLIGEPTKEIVNYVTREKVGALVTDFNPLKWSRKWKNDISKKVHIPFYEVDAHNIVPVWEASPKQEFGAFTLRPKLRAKLEEFEDFYPPIHTQKSKTSQPKTDWRLIRKSIRTDDTVKPVKWLQPGEQAATALLETFIKEKLSRYDAQRNDPTKIAQSQLSPYLHFGHISSQTIVLRLSEVSNKKEVINAFREEIIVRKELSDNYCFYNDNYDNPNGFPDWAKKTLEIHAQDVRAYLYTRDELENAKTHDPLWNAAQIEMLTTGKMHGYMRMYWAKKIYEWSTDVQIAQENAIYLNNRYFLDGRDPNGYTGIAWSIGGVHDRAWFERPIFGKIRYMSYAGAKSKFAIQKYIAQSHQDTIELYKD